MCMRGKPNLVSGASSKTKYSARGIEILSPMHTSTKPLYLQRFPKDRNTQNINEILRNAQKRERNSQRVESKYSSQSNMCKNNIFARFLVGSKYPARKYVGYVLEREL